jgi:hypothetical protein
MTKRIMRLSVTSVLVLAAVAVFALAGCNKVEKPELKGHGPLTVTIMPGVLSPEYHQPVEYWKQHHMDIIKNGDFNRQECTLCHNMHTSCNNCHDYVGVARVEGYE